MKNLIKLTLALLLPAVMWSCKKDENKDYLVGGTAPVLTSNVSGTIPLSDARKNDVAVTFNWTNPNYQFTTGTSSQDVSYLLEIDTTGSNFTSPKRQSVSISKELSITFTQGQLNDYLLNQLQLSTTSSHNLEFRITSTLGKNQAILYSNVLKYSVQPYAIPPKVEMPAGGHLYLVGSATAGGWNNPVPVPTQEFTKINPTLYEITVPLSGGNEYLLLPLNGDWGHKYAVPDKNVPGLSAGGDFKKDANDNFPGPAVSGIYKIQVDFQRGKFTVTKQ
ncbi:MAG: hypothetical protein NVSMB45_12410 [Ginsengibacter sp.]